MTGGVGALTLTKSANPNSYIAVGQQITYTYGVKNTGSVDLAGPFTVTDNKVTVSCPAAASLAPNASLTCTASHSITQADLDAGSITNKATASNGTVTSPQAQATVTAVGNQALTLTKTATPTTYTKVGDVIGYSYGVKNSGNVTLVGPFTVTDNKVTVTCPATASLAPNASRTCTASYSITQADLDNGSVTNKATASNGTVTSPQAQATVTAVPNQALTLTKTANPTTYTKVGDVIGYSYGVKNSGNVTLAGPFTVTDNKVTVTCPATASLAPNASLTCTASHSITQADLDAGSVTNTATAKAGNTTSNAASQTVTAEQGRALTLTKTATPTTYTKVGDVIGYSYGVKNSGNVTLAGPFTVTDDKVTVTCPATASLAPNASLTCTASYSITQADLDAGSITNKATASNGTITSPQAQATVTAQTGPALTLTKTATPTTYTKVGDVIGYSYGVKNSGNVTLAGPFTVTDNKVTVTCPATASLAPNASLTCTASYSITQADLDAGSITNKATASNGTITSPQAQATVTAQTGPALTLTKTATPTTYTKVGDVIGYSYGVKNSGNVTLAGPFTVTDNKVTVTCPATASLAPNASLTCTASHSITQADLDAGSVTNTATAKAGNTTSNAASQTVTAEQGRALTLTKTATPTTYTKVGDVIGYSYGVKNSGNVTLAGPFTVTDDKVTVTCPATASLAPNASLTCTASHSITQADLDAGSVTNTATAKAGNTTSNAASQTVTAEQGRALTLTKTATPTTYTKVGDVIGYSYGVKNSGNVTLSGPFSVSDDKVTVTCPATASLAPNASLTCTASHSITQADLDAGSITNKATASNGTITSPQAQATVTAQTGPALTLTKTATPTTYTKVGDVIGYSYGVKNSGNVTLSGPFSVSDDKVTVTCPATASLAPNASLTCTASYSITQADLDAGSITNKATASNGTITSPQAQATVTAQTGPALTLTKTATPTTYTKVGDVIGYSYGVKNSGNVTLSGPFSVSDDKVTVTCPATASLAPNASLTCTASHSITQADLDAGSITNKATASNGTITSPQAQATVTAQTGPALTLTKTATPTTYTKVGDVIGYSYGVKNSGNVTLSGPFSVSDDKVTVTCPATASLAPNASLTCTASHSITQADLDAGSITNKATASNGTITSPQAQATVTAQTGPALTLTKTATPTTYTKVGDVIGYSYGVKNSGNVTLAGPFTVTDDKVTVTCPATASLALNASLTCTASYSITQADLDAGSVTNTARAQGKAPNGSTVTSNQTQATVTANLPPKVTNPGSQSSKEGDTVNLQIDATSRPAGHQLSYSAIGLPKDLSINSSTGLISGTVNYDAAGSPGPSYSVTVKVTDTITNLPESVTFSWTVEDTNRSPVAQNDSASTPSETAVAIPVLVNDYDPDSDPLTIQSVGVSGGTVNIVDGVLIYTPAMGFTGQDSFTYTISDGHSGTASATVTVQVTAKDASNHPPTAVADSATTHEGVPIAIAVLPNDYDLDGNALTLMLPNNTTQKGGVVNINDNGTPANPADDFIDYSPLANFTGDDAFTYQVSDGHGGTDTAIVSVVVLPADKNLPTAVGDGATTPMDQAVTINVLANDIPPTVGEPLSIKAVSQGAHGNVAIVGNQVLYTPALGFIGNDTFTYTISDQAGHTASAAVTVTLKQEGTPPEAPVNFMGQAKLLLVNLIWEGSEGATQFRVYRKLNTENAFTQIGEPTPYREFVDNLPAGTTSAQYYVVAENQFGSSGPSQTIEIKPSVRRR